MSHHSIVIIHVNGDMTNFIIFMVIGAHLLVETGVQRSLVNNLKYVYLQYSGICVIQVFTPFYASYRFLLQMHCQAVYTVSLDDLVPRLAQPYPKASILSLSRKQRSDNITATDVLKWVNIWRIGKDKGVSWKTSLEKEAKEGKMMITYPTTMPCYSTTRSDRRICTYFQ